MTDDATVARKLLSPEAVRQRAQEMLRLAEADQLAHWRLERAKVPKIADFTLDVTRDAYPDLNVPFHARWRHFEPHGEDRWAAIAGRANWRNADERARAEFDLAIVSVLLDAGAGPAWRYRDEEGSEFGRSEGLAIASLDMFASGLFSDCAADPLRADARRLASITAEELADGLQVSDSNPLTGLSGRVVLLNALGRTCLATPGAFARSGTARPGGLYDLLARGDVKAADILRTVLDRLGPIWPSRIELGGVPLGDTWRHPLIRASDASDGLVPFHKLSQWLSYSLIEPLQRSGVEVTEIDDLTGLPEYRNGGLFIDLGALVPRHQQELHAPLTVDSLLIVEWRALTVALLDEIAGVVRAKLGLDASSLPLACVLQGGSWSAGRRIAAQRRADGSPPINIVSDGTVF